MSYYYRRNLLLYPSADAPTEASKLIKIEISTYDKALKRVNNENNYLKF